MTGPFTRLLFWIIFAAEFTLFALFVAGFALAQVRVCVTATAVALCLSLVWLAWAAKWRRF